MKRFCLTLALLVCCSSSAALAANDDAISINVHKPTVTERTFVRDHMPPEMPPLTKNEAAVTVSEFAATVDARATVVNKVSTSDGVEATVRITGLTVEPRLTITIWLPTDANQKLRDHEYGHRTISEHFYRTIKEVTDKFARKVVGKTFKATGRNEDAAAKNAIRKAIAEVNSPLLSKIDGTASKAQDRYDALTDHGRNKTPESDAIRQAIGEVQ